jgi:hypothetical protein
MIAICNPELIGDVLWSIPAARELARRHSCQVDFWISWRARNCIDLLSAQKFIRYVGTLESHEYWPNPEFPHEVRLPEGKYEKVYQLGFDRPPEGTLLDYFCERAGVPRQGHYFDLPEGCPMESLPDAPFVCLAAKGNDCEQWRTMFREIVCHCPLPVVEVGVPGSAVAADFGSIDRCRWGFLEMVGIISKCKYFIGQISSPLVVADAFPNVTRIAVHDNKTWQLKHCTMSPMNYYIAGWDAKPILELLK